MVRLGVVSVVAAFVVVAACGCTAVNPLASERDVVEENIRIGIAADSPLGAGVFRANLDDQALQWAESDQYSITIKPVELSPHLAPYQLVRMEIQSDEGAAARFEHITGAKNVAGVGVVDLGNGTYRACIVASTPPGYPIPVFQGEEGVKTW